MAIDSKIAERRLRNDGLHAKRVAETFTLFCGSTNIRRKHVSEEIATTENGVEVPVQILETR